MAEINVEVEINTDAVLSALHEQIEKGLDAIGETAMGYAQDDCPVNTGRLRNSIAYVVEGDEVQIGTNVEYAPYIEYGTGIYAEEGGRTTPWVYQNEKGEWVWTRGQKPTHFLRDSATGHLNEYQAIMQASLES